ncbi:MAG: indolepyruvate ferredoxin oxidoreductase subunit alpha [Firmicutes bacterium]|nr:indolepyruvate ferredoxin oxidoreductase subunit alpha [Bacillota bacterium]
MKKLLLGNDAVARGLYEAGCAVASSYPGTPSTEITEALAKYDDIFSEWAPNEKVAMEVAFGAALGGKRSFCGMKHVGLNVAADPLFTISYTGVNAGMVIAVADDPAMHSSQNEQDSRHYAIAAKIPMLEPADSSDCLEYAKLAYAISEEFDTPVLLRLCTRIAHSQSITEIGERIEIGKPYTKDAAKYVMMPAYAKLKHPIVEKRIKDLQEYAETNSLNRIEWGSRSIGIITSGTSYQYAKEVFGDEASILKLGMVYPLPDKTICDFAAAVDRLVVIEELDPVIENQCRALGLKVEGKEIFSLIGEFSQNLLAEKFGRSISAGCEKLEQEIPNRPPVMCAGCPHRGLFYTLMKQKLTVLGDIGCYTLGAVAPLSAMDMTLCMGASISALHGFNHADTGKKAVAVIGDSTFMHSGMTGLADIAYNGSASTVIILDNSITGMTGHQQNPTTGLNIKGDPAGRIDLEALCKAIGINRVRVVDPYNLAQNAEVIKEEVNIDEPSVIISRRPCALLKTVKPKPALTVDVDACKGCKLCMRIGCPAISIKNDKASVDATLCVGCGICTQLCAFDALQGYQEEV